MPFSYTPAAYFCDIKGKLMEKIMNYEVLQLIIELGLVETGESLLVLEESRQEMLNGGAAVDLCPSVA